MLRPGGCRERLNTACLQARQPAPESVPDPAPPRVTYEAALERSTTNAPGSVGTQGVRVGLGALGQRQVPLAPEGSRELQPVL